MLTFISATVTSFADNLYSDNLLQPIQFEQEADGWSLSAKLGIHEGTGEITNDGYRMELPRISFQKNYNNDILFRATLPYVYLNNDEISRYTLGDPSFFTSLKTSENASFTVGVTEPAANRPIEPDVVRFMAFYTAFFPIKRANIRWQLGTEIPDRYNDEGQDDILSFGLALDATSWSVNFIKKQVVDGRWWDITKPLENDLNRTNLTLQWHRPIRSHWIDELTVSGGIQYNEESQWWLGLGVR